MNDAVAVSVIVPIYNGERYIRNCLDSVLVQTLGNIEVICVDDGSTDSTSSILREYAKRDPRILVIEKENGGYGHSMNVGIDRARGRYVTSVDSDDYLLPNAIELMYSMAERDSLDFAKADRVYFSGEAGTDKLSINKIGTKDEQYTAVFNPSKNPAEWLMGMGLPGLYRKSFLDECNIRHNETPGASFQDTGFSAQLMFNARRARILDEPIYMVRRDNSDSSTLDLSKVYCICDEYDFVRKVARKSRSDVQVCLKSAAAMRFQGYKWNVKRLAPEDRAGFISRARTDFEELDSAGEIEEEFFSAADWAELQKLMHAPLDFYADLIYAGKFSRQQKKIKKQEREIKKLKAENADLRGSGSYRVGRIITWAPRKVFRIIPGRKKTR